MENKVLRANLNAVKRYNEQLYNKILRINDIKSTFELSKTQKDEYNLLFNGFNLHSGEGAVDEAKKVTNSIDEKDNKNSAIVIYGLGLGYLADEVIQQASGTVIIYEPNIELLKVVLEIVEFEKNLSQNNVFLCSDMKTLMNILDKTSDKNTKITVTFLDSYYKLFKNDILSFAKSIETVRGEKLTNTNTINRLGRHAVINTLSSLDKIIKTPLVNSLCGTGTEKTALIASAGPSLANSTDVIRKNRSKFILFAVGPALKLLDKHNIKPDFLCITECISTKGQIEDIDLKDVSLIVEPYTHPYVWELNTKNKFLFFSDENFLNNKLAKLLGIKTAGLKSIGTVSYMALACAKIMGFEKIILTGQDLAFSNGRCYAKGSAYEGLECIFKEETGKYEIVIKDKEAYKKALMGKDNFSENEAELKMSRYLKQLNSTIYSVKSQDGKMLPTQAGYSIFIKYFEKFAKENPKLDLINSSTGGAEISGFKNIPLESALKEVPEIENFDMPDNNINYNLEKLNRETADVLKDLNNVLLFSDELSKLTQTLTKEIQRRKTTNSNTEKMAEKIKSSITTFSNKYYDNEIIFYLCAPYTNRITHYLENLKIDSKNYTSCIGFLQKNTKELDESVKLAIQLLLDKKFVTV